jgi:hypothetical protein
MKRRALAEDDFILGLQLFKVDSRDAKIKLEREKFVDSSKCKGIEALDCCFKEAKKYPEVLELFRHAFGELRKTRAA